MTATCNRGTRFFTFQSATTDPHPFSCFSSFVGTFTLSLDISYTMKRVMILRQCCYRVNQNCLLPLFSGAVPQNFPRLCHKLKAHVRNDLPFYYSLGERTR